MNVGSHDGHRPRTSPLCDYGFNSRSKPDQLGGIRQSARDTDFPIQNLPYASFRKRGEEQIRVGVAIGDMVLDASQALAIPSLSRGYGDVSRGAHRLTPPLERIIGEPFARARSERSCPMSEVELLLPCDIPDYTDFFASLHHATNVGSLFRPDKPLSPNYKWIPIAYHGRARPSF